MHEEIMVSVCMLAYNHEKYIRQAIEGVLMQKTTFKYELLIHDDASTDHTADIIREYEQKYPEIVKPIYQTENQYSKGVKVSIQFQYPRAKGKYLAFCEGDDYWTDENKLQLQFDRMENNDCVVCFHKVEKVTEKGDTTGEFFPNKAIERGIIKSEDLMNILLEEDYWQFHLNSCMVSMDIIRKRIDNPPMFIEIAKVGDVPLFRFCACFGNAYYIDRTMSCYRVNSSSSVSKKLNNSSAKTKIDFNYARVKELEALDEYTCYKYTDKIRNLINIRQCEIFILNGEYSKLFDKKYRRAISSLTLKSKIYYYICSVFPAFANIYEGLKNGR